MTETLEWDALGAKTFETGVSKAILWTSEVGVPWNGLVSVSIDPTGGEPNELYFDGRKYLVTIDAEDFDATITCINTPTEFEACEGVKTVAPGMKVRNRRRAKFHMAWKTLVGNDIEGTEHAYKLHILYNGVVLPSQRSYTTLGSSTSPEIRNLSVKTTPACGPDSYYVFDSREADLSELEALLFTGTLPACYELTDLVSVPGDGGTVDPTAGCPYMLEDFESFAPGLTNILYSETDGVYERSMTFKINNGLNIITLPANGSYAVNDSLATVTGTQPVLSDSDDATYISSDEGDLGYTVALPQLKGWKDGSQIELHIRMSITGDVSEDDPDNIDADAQVHISTDATGDTTIGGFSDGADEGMGFELSAVDGTIVDYVVPLSMDAWVDSTVDDVVAALEAGAYLNIVGVTNNNEATTPEVRVYEASVVILDLSDQTKFARPVDEGNNAEINLAVADTEGGAVYETAQTSWVDFKAMTEPYTVTTANPERAGQVLRMFSTDDLMYGVNVVVDGTTGKPKVELMYADVEYTATPIDPDVWYTAEVYFGYSVTRMTVKVRDTGFVVHTEEVPTTYTPRSAVTANAGHVGDGSDVSYEMAVDNVKIQIHCNEEAPSLPPGTYTEDIPATFISVYPLAASGGTGALEVDDADSSRVASYAHNLPKWAAPTGGNMGWYEFQYGDGPNKFNWDQPPGSTVTNITYLIDAKAESVDADGPTILLGNATRTSDEASFDLNAETGGMSFTWTGVTESAFDEAVDGSISAVLVDDEPLCRMDFIYNATGEVVITYVTYVAIRVTYTIP